MGRIIENFENTVAPDTDYPYGRIKDKEPGVGPGTPVNEQTYGDVHQFFARLMALAGVNANGLPDNEYTGWQFMEALDKYFGLTKVKSTTSNGLSLDVTISAGSPWTTGAITYQYHYWKNLANKTCNLNFKVSFNATDGANLTEIQIPLPEGINKDVSVDGNYELIGYGELNASPSTTDRVPLTIRSYKDGSEGQRLVLNRSDSTGSMEITTGADVIIEGSIILVVE